MLLLLLENLLKMLQSMLLQRYCYSFYAVAVAASVNFTAVSTAIVAAVGVSVVSDMFVLLLELLMCC